MSEPIPSWYQWNYRPQKVEWPDWFRAWPGGARVAVSLKIMHEWEGTPRPMGRAGVAQGAAGLQDYWSLCAREYGFKAGIWRLLDVLDKHQARTTVMVSGLAAELWPDSVREAHRRGHEVAPHGWDQAVHPSQFKSREEEKQALARSLSAVAKVIGERPCGYMSQGPRPTVHTLELLAEEALAWSGDYHDSDVPYVMHVNGKRIVSVGYVKPAFTDNDIIPLGLAAGLQQLKDEFDAVYAESARRPMKFAYAMHAHNSGSPGMAKLLDNFIEYVKRHDGVWFCRCRDMADFWLANDARPAS